MSQTCLFSVDDRIFSVAAVLKTAYLYLDRYYLHLDLSGEHRIEIEISSKEGGALPQSLPAHFQNDLIAQMTRQCIAEDEKNTRELILGRALYSTCLETEESDEAPLPIHPEFNLEDIAVSWKGDTQ